MSMDVCLQYHIHAKVYVDAMVIHEPVHDKINIVTHAHSEFSDQWGYQLSHIRI